MNVLHWFADWLDSQPRWLRGFIFMLWVIHATLGILIDLLKWLTMP